VILLKCMLLLERQAHEILHLLLSFSIKETKFLAQEGSISIAFKQFNRKCLVNKFSRYKDSITVRQEQAHHSRQEVYS
jgi:hypothetical protein